MRKSYEELYALSSALGATIEELQTLEQLGEPLTVEAVHEHRKIRRELAAERRADGAAEWDQGRSCWVGQHDYSAEISDVIDSSIGTIPHRR